MLVPQPTTCSVRRLFVASRGIFFEKRTIASPNTAVRSSRSNAWRARWLLFGPSFNAETRGEISGYPPACKPPPAFGACRLELLWMLAVGVCDFTCLAWHILLPAQGHEWAGRSRSLSARPSLHNGTVESVLSRSGRRTARGWHGRPFCPRRPR